MQIYICKETQTSEDILIDVYQVLYAEISFTRDSKHSSVHRRIFFVRGAFDRLQLLSINVCVEAADRQGRNEAQTSGRDEQIIGVQ